MIILKDLEKVYTTDEIETQALTRINLEVKNGEFLSVMGPSGCGKSTLLNMIGLLDVPTGGTVDIDGNLFDGWSDKALAAFRNEKLGFIFQSFHLINDLPVIDNVELPLLYRKGISGKQRRTMAIEALERIQDVVAEVAVTEHPDPSLPYPAVRRTETEGGHRPCRGGPARDHPGR